MGGLTYACLERDIKKSILQDRDSECFHFPLFVKMHICDFGSEMSMVQVAASRSTKKSVVFANEGHQPQALFISTAL